VKPLTLPDNWADLDNDARRLHIATHATDDPMVAAALRLRLTGRPSPNGGFPAPSDQPAGRDHD